MIKFPKSENYREPPQKKMVPEEYLRFCDFCLKNNPHIASHRKTREEEIKIPFRL